MPVVDYLQQALAKYLQRIGQARALTKLGIVEQHLDRYRLAGDYFRQALAIYLQARDRIGQARALTNLGIVEQHLDRYRLAGDYFRQALAIYLQADDRISMPEADHVRAQLATLDNTGP
jgi:tetratricopeptide (TPR) repeat protein